MSVQQVGVVAGMVSTSLFVLSYLPMLIKAGRSKDLRSYSAGNLVIANVGNVIHSVYVFSLPPGPIWFLHSFYVVSTALMLIWFVRYRHRGQPDPGATVERPPTRHPAVGDTVGRPRTRHPAVGDTTAQDAVEPASSAGSHASRRG